MPIQLLRPRPGPSHQARLMDSDSFPRAPWWQDTKAHTHTHRTHAQTHAQPEIPTLTCNTFIQHFHTHTHTCTHLPSPSRTCMVAHVPWHALTCPQAHPCTHIHTHLCTTLAAHIPSHTLAVLQIHTMALGLSYGASCAFFLAPQLACEFFCNCTRPPYLPHLLKVIAL